MSDCIVVGCRQAPMAVPRTYEVALGLVLEMSICPGHDQDLELWMNDHRHFGWPLQEIIDGDEDETEG